MIKDGIYAPAKLAPSPNKGGFIKPRLIIVHDTAGGLDAAGSVAWLRNPASKASAHFVVARDGEVTQLIATNLKASHAGVSSYKGVKNVNDFSVGIEIVNPGALQPAGAASARASFGAIYDRKKYLIEELLAVAHDTAEGHMVTHQAGLWMPYTQAQLDAVLALCLALKTTYGITEVAPHWYISPRRKVDTNPLFPLRWLRAKLEGRETVEDKEPELKPAATKSDIKLPDIPSKVHAIPSIGPRKAKLKGTHYYARRWPSFNSDNFIQGVDTFDFASDEISFFKATGNQCPSDLEGVEFAWYKLRHPDGSIVWALQTSVESIL